MQTMLMSKHLAPITNLFSLRILRIQTGRGHNMRPAIQVSASLAGTHQLIRDQRYRRRTSIYEEQHEISIHLSAMPSVPPGLQRASRNVLWAHILPKVRQSANLYHM